MDPSDFELALQVARPALEAAQFCLTQETVASPGVDTWMHRELRSILDGIDTLQALVDYHRGTDFPAPEPPSA